MSVSQLDSISQSNAASAQQMAATAEELNAQAQKTMRRRADCTNWS